MHSKGLTTNIEYLMIIFIATLHCVVSQVMASELEHVTGVAGYKAELPCYLDLTDKDDRAILALWYKQGRRLPVYSYDARLPKGEHKTDRNVLGTRGRFITNTNPSQLRLNPVKDEDAGIYTCRVDYLTSPTHNTVVNFTVIEPPHNMTIYQGERTKVLSKNTQPVNEGSPVELTCVVYGGRPPPRVTWRADQYVEEGVYAAAGVNQVKNVLRIEEVTRSFNNKVYTCEGENNKQEEPLTQTVIIDMNLRPLNVMIKLPNKPLVAYRKYQFNCESNGSKPPSLIEWFLENKKIDALQTTVRSAGELTIGTATLTPKETDHGKTLKCVASNPKIEGSRIISHSVKLSIQYIPIVHVQIGRSIDIFDIKQGTDVYIECLVDANPEPHTVSWFKDGEKVHHNKSSGILVANGNLVLQKVHRSYAGNYTCLAVNSLGNATSNAIELDIKFSPECAMSPQPTMLAVGRGEKVDITCKVASNPLTALFHWQLNGSERIYSYSSEHGTSGHLVSNFNFMGTVDKDYGSLHCWANNSVGMQKDHCLFNIIPAGPPSAPEDCLILNHTAENIEVGCEKGFDGGLKQRFLAEVYEEHGSIHRNTSADQPIFSVDSLRPSTSYDIKVSAYNEKGRSPYVSLTAFTAKVAESKEEEESLLYSPSILIFLSILGGFAVIVILLFLATRWRRSNFSSVREPSSPVQSKIEKVASVEPLSVVQPEHETTATSKSEPVPEKPKIKPKKKVLVVENGKIERPGISSSSPDSQSSREALITRTNEGGVSSSSYYSATERNPPIQTNTGFHASPKSSPTYPSRYGLVEQPAVPYRTPYQRPYQRTLPPPPYSPPRALTLSPLVEEYTPSQHHYSTLPRRREMHRESSGRNFNDSERNFSASVEDRYHLVPEWKGNPKYIIRTRDRESVDESFV